MADGERLHDMVVEPTLTMAPTAVSSLLRLAASAAFGMPDVHAAYAWAVDLVCEYTGWPLGHVWELDESTGTLVSSGIWHDDDPTVHAPFRAASHDLVIAAGVGLPGRILETAEPLWTTDLGAEQGFPRAPIAAMSGVHAGLGFPIVTGRGVEGVVEFFASTVLEPDAELLDWLSHIGIQLGAAVERARTEAALSASEARLRSLIESAPDGLIVVDANGTIVSVNDEVERISGHHRDALLGQGVEMLVPEASRVVHTRLHRSFLQAPHRRAMGAGRGLTLVRADGTQVPVDVSLSPIDPAGDGLVVAAVRDVSERHRAEEAARRRDREIAEAQRLAQIGSWTWDIAADQAVGSVEFQRIFGLEPVDGPIPVSTYVDLVHDEDRAELLATAARARAQEARDHEFRVVRADGEVRWVHFNVAVVDVEDGEVVRLGGYAQDTTGWRHAEERRDRAQQELSSHQRVLERVARGEPVATTLDWLCRDIESTYRGARCSVLLVDPVERCLLDAAGPSLPKEFRMAMDRMPIAFGMGACGEAAASGQITVVADTTDDRLTRVFVEQAQHFELRSVWSYPLKSSTGEVLGTFAVYRSVTHTPDEDEIRVVGAAGNVASIAIERDRSEQALLRAAQLDPLTGLLNRARFLEELRRRLADGGVADLAVMFLDLDGFKWINDSLGHPAGDRVLIEVAARLQAALGPRRVLARFGGDEFTVLVDDAAPVQLARAAEAVQATCREPFLLDGGEFFLTVSVGVARNDGTTDASGLVRDADAAMYAAKEAGRGRFVVFDEGLRERATSRVTLESELRRAIERHELVLHYQPIVDSAGGAWIGVEALARWQHPSRGLLGPDEFIPLAEETGLIIPLGTAVLEQGLEQAARWAAEGTPLTMSVNLSVAQLSDPQFAHDLAALLTRYELAPELLILEVTESVMMEHLEIARAVLGEVAALGVRLVIDDFGTGYSSIARLGELPVVGIKIDRSFTIRLGTDPSVHNVVAAIIELARALDLGVVAEGVEDETALHQLQALGCDLVQGYHFARPMPAAEVPARRPA